MELVSAVDDIGAGSEVLVAVILVADDEIVVFAIVGPCAGGGDAPVPGAVVPVKDVAGPACDIYIPVVLNPRTIVAVGYPSELLTSPTISDRTNIFSYA
ncbi:hypothetical protein PG999_008307 [Apiospora kogelbergensis]|uniref:Uncharacterized protein n=1 Tax=Apiospora kogelbergensis TaxID=1337665 RepID=A0AAW0QRJ5_9PEZI